MAFMQGMNTRNVAEIEPLLDRNVAFDFPGIGNLKRRKVVSVFLRGLLADFANLHFQVVQIFGENGQVAVQWQNTGERRNGQPFANKGVTVFRISDGHIVEVDDFLKNPA